MITTAVAGLDLFAWLLYQRFEKHPENNALFTKLIENPRFFKPKEFVNSKVLYQLGRCGVVHQYYPKGLAGIGAWDSNEVFYQHANQAYLNVMGFYRTTLFGLQKVRDHILKFTPAEAADLDLKLALRATIDLETLDGARLDIASLPIRPAS